MAKTQNPLIGRASGQAGGMIFSKSFDKNIIRSRPMTVSNPNTPAQQRQREFFSELTAIAKTVTPDMLVDLFPDKPTKNSRYSELQKQLAVGRDVSGVVGLIDFDEISKIGNGISCLTGTGVTASIIVGNLLINWSALDITAPAVSSDPVYAFVVNSTNKQTLLLETELTFADTAYEGSAPSGWNESDDVFAFIMLKPAGWKAGTDLSGGIK
jgi:hypothetical protein